MLMLPVLPMFRTNVLAPSSESEYIRIYIYVLVQQTHWRGMRAGALFRLVRTMEKEMLSKWPFFRPPSATDYHQHIILPYSHPFKHLATSVTSGFLVHLMAMKRAVSITFPFPLSLLAQTRYQPPFLPWIFWTKTYKYKVTCTTHIILVLLPNRRQHFPNIQGVKTKQQNQYQHWTTMKFSNQ
jgi:hypothetical protein